MDTFIIHTCINVSKQMKIRIKSKKFLMWMALIIVFYFIEYYISILIIIFLVAVIILYYSFETYEAMKTVKSMMNSDMSDYGIFYNNDYILLYNGREYGDQIKFDEIWIAFDNLCTKSLTLYLKKDNSYINVFRSNVNALFFDEFKKLLLQKIKYIK